MEGQLTTKTSGRPPLALEHSRSAQFGLGKTAREIAQYCSGLRQHPALARVQAGHGSRRIYFKIFRRFGLYLHTVVRRANPFKRDVNGERASRLENRRVSAQFALIDHMEDV